ncbi:hypothetical protein CS063_12255 [Sporanaerobium hydrogeniformans]|uniref:Uncharacterized protein n=1 Tax=Sporanaerobium hydrogeniformans TaxID=3072179 RepID=A0AC61DBP0_9FIRM|nr:DUF4179 domain-containing protein [Sporanaerobium hydrogeniformans]PHV70071.1 hypothetical protein CS063_12255 [Sporanaerobium hydrogeniformans]
MRLKVSNLVESLQEEILKEIDEVYVEEELKLNIKRKTLEKIYANNESSFKQEASKKVYRRTTKRFLALVAVLIGSVGILVGAMSVNDSIYEWFSENISVILPHAQEINASVSQNGLTVTVDTAVAGNSGGLILISVTKDDGSSFEGNEEFKTFKVMVDEVGSAGSSYEWDFSQDKKKMTYIVNLSVLDTLTYKPVTLKASDLAIVTPKEKEVPINLKEILQKEPPTQDVFDRPEGEGISLQHPDCDARLQAVYFEGDKLCIEMAYTSKEKGLWQRVSLVDTRTGKLIDTSRGSSESSTGESNLSFTKDIYEGLTVADLPYLKLMNQYNDYEYLALGEWELHFKLNPNENVKKSKRTYKIPVEEGYVEVNQVELSIVGGSIEGKAVYNETKEGKDISLTEDFTSQLPIILRMKDGTKVQMYHYLSSYGGDNGEYGSYIKPGKPWESYAEEEKERLREEALEKRYVRVPGFTSILPEQFIAIEKVESLQIKDVVIPLY